MRIPASLLLSAALAVSAASPSFAALPTPRVSPDASVSQTVGITKLTVTYCRPGVKGRAIWGALVPYDKPWRTGANEITTFTATTDVKVEGQVLPAGTYGVVTIPGATTWTVAFSKQKEMWGAFSYDPKQDQLRVTVKPEGAESMEWMQFAFDDPSTDACTLALRWEKVRVPVKIQVDVNATLIAAARAAVAAAPADDWSTRYRAASYLVDHDDATAEVQQWAAAALKIKANFFTTSLAAKIAHKAGQNQNAIAQMTAALAMAKADTTVEAVQVEPMTKLLAEWTAKK